MSKVTEVPEVLLDREALMKIGFALDDLLKDLTPKQKFQVQNFWARLPNQEKYPEAVAAEAKAAMGNVPRPGGFGQMGGPRQ